MSKYLDDDPSSPDVIYGGKKRKRIPNPNMVTQSSNAINPPKTVTSYAPMDLTQLSDAELLATKPPPTGYNSQEGYRIINGQKYMHGEIGPDGKPVDAPILTWDEWSYLFEKFEYRWKEQKTVKIGEKEVIKTIAKKEYRPAILNNMDHIFLEAIESNDMALILSYRGSRKSANGTRFVKRMILDYGATVGYFSATANLAKDYLKAIIRELTFNVQILRWYGYIIDEETGRSVREGVFWMTQRDSASREPGLVVGSAEGTSRLGGHPQYIVLDDVVTEECSGSDTKLEAIQEWYTKQIDPMLTTSDCKMIVIGTMKDPHDLYNFLIDTEMFIVQKIPAIYTWPNGGQEIPGQIHDPMKWYYVYHNDPKTGQKLKGGVANIRGGLVSFQEYNQRDWNRIGRVQYYVDDDPSKGLDKNRMAMQEFLMKLARMTIESFKCEFQMIAIVVGGSYLKFDKIRMFDLTKESLGFDPNELKTNVNAFFDQSFGETNRADFNCISVVGERDEKFYILDLFIWRNDGRGVFQKAEMIEMVKKKYPFIMQFGIEAGQINAEDTATLIKLLPDIDLIPVYQNKKKSEDDTGIETVKLMIEFSDPELKKKQGKIIRIINQWSTKLVSDAVFMRNGIDYEAIEEFDNEKSFPKCKKFDVIDSIGSAFDLCSSGMGLNTFWAKHGEDEDKSSFYWGATGENYYEM